MFQKRKKLNMFYSCVTKLIVGNTPKYPDWSDRDDIKAPLKMDIIMKLHQYGYPPTTQDDVYINVLEQAENFKKYR